ncbi:MAG TPA: ParB/RepB/Spo0J family partition protein [Gammaproteobacteria bacterium]|nr:ParB/RepB/Spo0J family partition protein [Gammaproteobacteria bacterium]
MPAKRKGLGRGLDALLGGAAIAGVGEDPTGELRQIPVDLMQRGKYQPRRDMHEEALKDLADSIRKQGVVQPIVVRPVGERSASGSQRYEIIAGERRWRAAQMAGLQAVPAVVRDVPDKTAIAMALIENIQRADLNPLEEAEAMQRLISEFDMTHQEAAEAVSRSRAAVTNLLRLLELTREVQDLVRKGALEMGHARALLALKGPAQNDAARRVVDRGLTVRDTELLVRRRLQELQGAPHSAKVVKADPNVRQLERQLTEKLGAKVVVEATGSKGAGKLVIHYTSLDELDGILAHIR